MERFAWKAVVKDGMLDEYINRHANIWPEMKDVLKKAGISNYTIWNTGNELLATLNVRRVWLLPRKLRLAVK